jgi:hypothetical protein
MDAWDGLWGGASRFAPPGTAKDFLNRLVA